MVRWLRCGWGMILWASCVSHPDTPATESSPFLNPVPLGPVEDVHLKEVSGLVASRKNPGMLWVHNDSGNPNEIYLLDSQAVVRAVYRLGETDEVGDWEDMAIGPGPEAEETYLYVGDIGDNFELRSRSVIYRFREPRWAGAGLTAAGVAAHPDTIRQIDALAFTYPDEARDAETLLLDPLTRDLYLLSKDMSSIHLYCLPFPQPTARVGVAELRKVLPFEGAHWLDRLVGGDISADGRELLLKTYTQIFYRERENSSLPMAEWLVLPADTLPYVIEPQGEAIGFAADGSGYFTLSERPSGTQVYLYFYPRRPPDNR